MGPAGARAGLGDTRGDPGEGPQGCVRRTLRRPPCVGDGLWGSHYGGWTWGGALCGGRNLGAGYFGGRPVCGSGFAHKGGAPGTPGPCSRARRTRGANGWPTPPRPHSPPLRPPLSSWAPLDSLGRRNVRVCFQVHRPKVGGTGRLAGQGGESAALEASSPPRGSLRLLGALLRPRARPGCPLRVGGAPGPRLCPGARRPPGSPRRATPCGRGLNLASAREPEGRGRGEGGCPGNPRHPLARPGRARFRERGRAARVQSAAVRKSVVLGGCHLGPRR